MLVIAILAIINWSILYITNGPNYKQIKQIHIQLEELELNIYNVLKSEKLVNKEIIDDIDYFEKLTFDLNNQAQETWDDIPGGTVITRNGAPVGDYSRVVEYKKEFKEQLKELNKKKREIVSAECDKLLETKWASYYEKRKSLIQEDTNIRKSHSWYYFGFIGKVFRIINFLSRIMSNVFKLILGIFLIIILLWVLHFIYLRIKDWRNHIFDLLDE